MSLCLVQHAEARLREEDPERPLSDKGLADIHKVATFLAGRIQPERILHSGKLRARQTAEVLAGHLKPSGGVQAAQNLSPLDDPAVWAEKLKDTDEDLILVGHMPFMSRLAALLLTGNADRAVVGFQMGGVVCLARDEETGGWSVKWMVMPELLG